jgi:hypothetical protein
MPSMIERAKVTSLSNNSAQSRERHIYTIPFRPRNPTDFAAGKDKQN